MQIARRHHRRQSRTAVLKLHGVHRRAVLQAWPQAAAALPDQLFLDGEGKKVAKSGLFRQFRKSDLAKGLAMILAGLVIFLIPENFLFIFVGLLLLAATVISITLTFRKVKKDNWNFQPHLVDATVSSALVATTVITFVKEGALFVMASGIFAALLFACSYNCMARAKKTSNRKYNVFLGVKRYLYSFRARKHADGLHDDRWKPCDCRRNHKSRKSLQHKAPLVHKIAHRIVYRTAS